MKEKHPNYYHKYIKPGKHDSMGSLTPSSPEPSPSETSPFHRHGSLGSSVVLSPRKKKISGSWAKDIKRQRRMKMRAILEKGSGEKVQAAEAALEKASDEQLEDVLKEVERRVQGRGPSRWRNPIVGIIATGLVAVAGATWAYMSLTKEEDDITPEQVKRYWHPYMP